MSIGEILKIAAIDTALGMGTVFSILILVSVVIWLMGKACAPKDAAAEGPEEAGVAGGSKSAPAINEDGLTPELVAAISAVAINQYKRDYECEEGDEYIVRNIRRTTWKRI